MFHKKYLQEPLVRSQEDLQVFLRRAPIDMLTIPGEDTSLTAQIKHMLDPKSLIEGDTLQLPASDVLAKKLGMSEQTLRRKLNAEGISYQQIKDNLRKAHCKSPFK